MEVESNIAGALRHEILNKNLRFKNLQQTGMNMNRQERDIGSSSPLLTPRQTYSYRCELFIPPWNKFAGCLY